MIKNIPIEKQAFDILEEYKGNNNFLINLKNKLKNKLTTLGKGTAMYVVEFHNKPVYGYKQWVKIDDYFGEELQKKFLLVQKPEKIYIHKILAQREKAIHIWGKVYESQEYIDIWVPKVSIIKEAKVNKVEFSEDHWEKYTRKPMLHQIEGIEALLSHDRFILALDMGAGKTYITIMSAIESKAQKILIVCPASLKINWKKEIEMCGENPNDIVVISGSKWETGYKWTIVNYDILKNFHTVPDRRKKDQKLIKSIIDENFDVIIGDECHLLKNTSANRTKLFNDFAEKYKKLWLLTGTPITNRPIDYYNLLHLVKSRLASSWVGFVKRYCNAKQFYGKGGRKIWDTKGASNLDELRENTKDVLLRKRKEEMLDLPEKIVQPIYQELTNKKEYEKIVGEYQDWLEHKKEITLALQLAKLVELRQFLAMEKLQSTIEIAESAIEEDKKVIIFTNFTQPLMELQKHFGKKCVIHNGQMTKAQKEHSVEEFQTNDNVKVFIGNIISAGIGITLNEAQLVIFNDLSWLPADHLQAQDRAHRIGQKNNVNVYYNIIDETLDLFLFQALMKKMKIIDTVMGDTSLDESMYKSVLDKIKKR